MADARLVFVAGASPQIITETIYALLAEAGCRSDLVTDVHVLTTVTGREAIRARLLNRGGKWAEFRRQYRGARRFRFTEEHITVLRDAGAKPLPDVRSKADNTAAADQIAKFVADCTAGAAPPLHASIAGGRKTMGYLLAAAMMLHGRAEDRLSHVLVHPPELEGTDFFFPPDAGSARALSYHGAGRRVVRVKPRQIKIDLAALPFPRLRALGDIRQRSSVSFSTLVEQLQGEIDVLTAARVSVQARQNLLICGTRGVHLSPVRATIYALLAERRRAGCRRSECDDCPVCFLSRQDVNEWLRRRLGEWMRADQRSFGVDVARWGERNFLPEVSKINSELRGGTQRCQRPVRDQDVGAQGQAVSWVDTATRCHRGAVGVSRQCFRHRQRCRLRRTCRRTPVAALDIGA